VKFGPGKLVQHGFARNSDWTLAASSADPQPDDKDPRIELVLQDSEETRAVYPHKFKVVYTVTLHNDHLKTEFRVINTGDSDMSFTGALHGYFEVVHVSKAKVSGLKGLKSLDKVPDPNNPVEGVMNEDILVFDGHVDKIFLDSKDYVELDVGTGAAIAVIHTSSLESGNCILYFRWLLAIGRMLYVGIRTRRCRTSTRSSFASRTRAIMRRLLRQGSLG